MPSHSGFRIHKQVAAQATVEVSEKGGVRYLHLGSRTIQSAMRLARPDDLELSYTRCMMAFLLFVPPPAQVVVIGLGGGSVAKFIHRRMKDALVTAVEINPQVVAAAHQFFQLPEKCERLKVELGDGAKYVQGLAGTADVLLVDGYGTDSCAPELATTAFYEDCERALSEDGVVVTNLFTGKPGNDPHVRLLKRLFPGRLLFLTDEHRGNLIAMAFNRGQGEPTWATLRERARELEALYGLEFSAFVEGLKERNPHDSRRLFI
jgi:spermidine synthase